jgi:hypothetical protein
LVTWGQASRLRWRLAHSINESGLAVGNPPMCGVRLVLAMTLPRNVNCVALLASPLFRFELRAERLNFLSVHLDDMVRNPVRLIIRFRSVLNVGASHKVFHP